MTDDDRDLRRLLGELREKDAQDIPEFESILARRSARTTARPRRGYLVAAFAVAAALVLIVAPRRSRERERTTTTVVELGSWQSPTAFLLEPPQALPTVGTQSITGSVIPDIPLHISQEKSP